jgi:hypothetical protein
MTAQAAPAAAPTVKPAAPAAAVRREAAPSGGAGAAAGPKKKAEADRSGHSALSAEESKSVEKLFAGIDAEWGESHAFVSRMREVIVYNVIALKTDGLIGGASAGGDVLRSAERIGPNTRRRRRQAGGSRRTEGPRKPSACRYETA